MRLSTKLIEIVRLKEPQPTHGVEREASSISREQIVHVNIGSVVSG